MSTSEATFEEKMFTHPMSSPSVYLNKYTRVTFGNITIEPKKRFIRVCDSGVEESNDMKIWTPAKEVCQ